MSSVYSQNKDSTTISIGHAAWIADRLDFADSCAVEYAALKRTCDSLDRSHRMSIDIQGQQIENLQDIITIKDFEIGAMKQQHQSYEREIAVIAKSNENLMKMIKQSSNSWKAPVVGLVVGSAVGAVVGYFADKSKGLGVGAIGGAGIGLVGTVFIRSLF